MGRGARRGLPPHLGGAREALPCTCPWPFPGPGPRGGPLALAPRPRPHLSPLAPHLGPHPRTRSTRTTGRHSARRARHWPARTSRSFTGAHHAPTRLQRSSSHERIDLCGHNLQSRPACKITCIQLWSSVLALAWQALCASDEDRCEKTLRLFVETVCFVFANRCFPGDLASQVTWPPRRARTSATCRFTMTG